MNAMRKKRNEIKWEGKKNRKKKFNEREIIAEKEE